jgi:hypothetical protein
VSITLSILAVSQVLELVSSREATEVHNAGGLKSTLIFITNGGDKVFRDALLSAMSIVQRCIGKVEPDDENLPICTEQLSKLLSHDDASTAQKALQCFATLAGWWWWWWWCGG